MKWSAPFGSLVNRLRGRSRPVLAALLVIALGGLATATYYGYQTYNYVQHDNDFCLSCHLMEDPFERFAKSSHRDLGCKACHRPTTVERSKMALTQILANPDEIKTHAEVPNETCMECHVEGDPEKWQQIASSAGHRIHIESKDSSLAGLKCVECHSSSLHEFAAVDKTCGQAGCHEDTEIRLGKMSRLSLHCAVCHEFNRPVAATVSDDSLHDALRPRSQECLSCHAMRERVGTMPADDPHGAVCGSCHNPHEQSTPAEAVETCRSCHAEADTLTPLHRGLGSGVLEQCTSCHEPHDTKIDATQCLDCHQNIFDDAPERSVARGTNSGLIHPVRSGGAASFVASGVSSVAVQQNAGTFRHSRHRQLQCSACHETVRSHGELKVTTARDCQSCHHRETAATSCASCHQATEYMSRTYRRTSTFEMSIGNRTRALSFNHAPHVEVACVSCHADPLTRAATSASCDGCHVQHHQPDASCRSCHTAAPVAAHPPGKVHITCAGSGCHSQLPAPVRSIPRTRQFCLACHQDLVTHQPAKNCASCHAMPAPRAAAAQSLPDLLARAGR